MSESEQSSAYGEWPLEPGPVVVRYPIDLLHEIDFNVKDAARRISHGGMETGGFLFGRTSMADRRDTVQIEAFRAIDCEHAFGPSFVLSERDLTKMREELLQAGSDPALEGMRLLGWYIGHARNPLRLSDHEASLFERLFPRPGQLTLLVKPERFVPSTVAFIVRTQDRKVDRDGTRIAFPLPPLSLTAPQPIAEEEEPEIAPVPADSAMQSTEALELGAPLSQPVESPKADAEVQSLPVVAAEPIVPEPASEPIALESIVPEFLVPDPVIPPIPKAAEIQSLPEVAAEPIVSEPAPEPIALELIVPEFLVSDRVIPPIPKAAAAEPAITKPVVPKPIDREPIVPESVVIKPVATPASAKPAVAPPPAVPEPVEHDIAMDETLLIEQSLATSLRGAIPPADPEPPVREIVPSSDFVSLEDLRARRLQRLERTEQVEGVEGSEARTPRPPTFALMQQKPPTETWKPLTALLAVLIVCAAAFWFYQHYFAPPVPLEIDDAIDKLMVSWPPDATRGSDASIRINGGAPIPLSAEERVLGRAEIMARGDDVHVELVVHHWYGDEHGRARFVKPVMSALP